MREQSAQSLVAMPLARVERELGDVAGWPRFLVGVQGAERLGHERYRFCLADGRDRREFVVCVRHDHVRHRFTWHSLSGPSHRGRIDLQAVDGGHTQVSLTVASEPGTLVSGFAEMVMPRSNRAAHDLGLLERLLVGGAAG